MIDFTEIFGCCIIPKNTLLYRGHEDIDYKDVMFFAFKFWLAGAFAINDKIQVWKTTTDIKVIFLCENVDYRSWTKSSIPKLYKMVFPEEVSSDYVDLDIKNNDIQRRNKFITKLYEDYGLSGWFTSFDGKMELEACLFNNEANRNQLKLIELANKDSKSYFKDSLKKIEIFPTKGFYDQTYEILRNNSAGIIERNEIWKKYKREIKSCIEENSETKDDIIQNREWWSNLRIRLKI